MKERGFKGLWIPKEIWLDETLSLQEKVFIAEIDSLDQEDGRGCFASNDYFEKFFDLSRDRVSVVINLLVEKGLIISKIDKNGGNKRSLTLSVETSIGYLRKQVYPIRGNKDCSIYNKEDNKEDTCISETETPQPELEISDEPIKETYKTRRKIFEQKGIPYAPVKRSSLQERTTQALLLIDYFKDKAFEEHRLQYFRRDSDKNGKIRKLAMTCFDRFADGSKDYIDWYLAGEGEWCSYEPDQCFSTRMFQRYENKDILEKKGGSGGGVIDLVALVEQEKKLSGKK